MAQIKLLQITAMKKIITTLAGMAKVALISTALLGVVATEAEAQFDMSLELNSRYVWRGADFGSSPSLMPEVSFTFGGFEIGAWAAYATNGNPDGTEINFFAGYTFETSAGDFSLHVTDYFFPDEPVSVFTGDAHFVEIGLSYETALSENTSLGLSTNMFVYNDDDNAMYHEISLTQALEDFELALFSGFTTGATELYENTQFSFINVGATLSREFTVGAATPLGVSASLITNPQAERIFFVFGASIGF